MADKDFRDELTKQIIQALENGTAPWQKPWSPETALAMSMPMNPTTGKQYHGGNALHLMLKAADQGYNDNRWMTYKQAAAQGWQVKKGEKSTAVEHWQFTARVPVTDEKTGEPVLKDGKPVYEEKVLPRPRVNHFAVFNAAQIDGVPEVSRDQNWNPVERGEAILKASGADIRHGGDQAFYRPGTDSIHLPAKEAFPDPAAYYGTALHELGHWTGHGSRLNRPGITEGHAFGSPEYAKEELRAELSSFFMAAQTGIPHDPERNAAYVGSWIQALQNDKNEIFRAAVDAEKATNFVLDLEKSKQVEIVQPELAIEPKTQDVATSVLYWNNTVDDYYGYTLKSENGTVLKKENFLSGEELGKHLGPDIADSIKQGIGYNAELSAKFEDIAYGRLDGLAIDLKPAPAIAPEIQAPAEARNLEYVTDPGHGWLGVPAKDLKTLGIEDRITPYSYAEGKNKVWLEEDVDFATYAKAAKDAGWQVDVKQRYVEHTHIRDLPSYDPAVGLRERSILALGSPIQVQETRLDGGRYSGKIIAEDHDRVAQSVGRNSVAIHEKRDLDVKPAIGQNVRISYSNWKGRVEDLAVKKPLEISR